MYRNSDSKLIGTYEYDLWGRPVSIKEASAGVDTDGILTKNPLRYRGYYYVNETGFYYLNARYYDPEVRRFISPDDLAYLGMGETVTGHNLFAYCGNNPVMGYDPTGNWDWGGVVLGAGLMVVGAVVLVACGASSPAAAVVSTAVIATGAVTTYAAANDSAMVVDMSGATPLLPGTYFKGGTSLVVDYENDNVNLYNHAGFGIGFSKEPSLSVGLVDNYEQPSRL